MFKPVFALLTLLPVIDPLAAFSQAGTGLKKIRINPESAELGRLSQYIDSVLFIPLELTKESRCSNIFQLKIADNHFIILDKETNAILIFTKSGKFHAKINIDKITYQFCLDKKNNQVEIIRYPKCFVYDMDGKLVRQLTLSHKPNTLLGVTKKVLDDTHTVYYNTSIKTTKDSLIHRLLIYKHDSIIHSFLPYPGSYMLEPFDHIGPINFSSRLDEADTGVYFISNYDYTVYRVTPSSCKPVYQFVFPAQMSLPPDFTTNTIYNGRRMAFLKNDQNNKIVSRLYQFSKKDDVLFFSEGRLSYMMNTKTQKLVCVSKLTPDALSYFLPVTDTQVEGNKKSVYLGYDGRHFYFSCSAVAFYNQMELKWNKETRYPPQLVNFFRSRINRTDGNPILVMVQFKNSF